MPLLQRTVSPAPVEDKPASQPGKAASTSDDRTSRKQPDVLTPLSERRYKIQLTAGQSLHDKLMQAQELLGEQVAPNDLAAVLEKGLDLLLKDLCRKRFAETDRPRRPRSEPAPKEVEQATSAQKEETDGRTPRYIPAEVKRTVAARDEYQCTFVDAETGRRCPERSNLQYHHDHPWGRGGSREPDNIRLLCRAHNLYTAEQDYGSEHMERRVAQARRRRKTGSYRHDEGGSCARERAATYGALLAGSATAALEGGLEHCPRGRLPKEPSGHMSRGRS